MKPRPWIAAGAFTLFALSQPASASWLTGWRLAPPGITMQLQLGSSSGTLIDGSTSWNTSAEDALALWNPHMNGLAFQGVRNSTAPVARRNAFNNVAFADDIYGDAFGDAVAVSLSLSRGGTLIEADVLFNRGLNWNSYRGNLRRASSGGTLYDFHRVALHEFGHVLGLDHPDEHGQFLPAIMNSRVSNTDALQADDTAGAQSMYGASGSGGSTVLVIPSDTLRTGARLLSGEYISSSNGRYRLVYQADGNLVLYDTIMGGALWASGTGNTSAGQAWLQPDGNFVVYNAQGAALWASRTLASTSTLLVVQTDGNLVLYGSDGRVLWDRYR